MGCGCGSPQERRGPPAYLSSPPSASATATAAASGSATPDRPEPIHMQPLVADPRLQKVQSAMREGDLDAAAKALRAARAQHQPAGDQYAQWSYRLGRMLFDAGDFAGAAVAFDEAASIGAWILRDYAALGAARAYAAAGKHGEAAARAALVRSGLPIDVPAQLTRADALDEIGRKEEAVGIWREHLAKRPQGTRWAEGAVRLAEALLEGTPDPNRAKDALSLARRVLSEAPTSSAATNAAELERKALQRLPSDDRSKLEHWPAEAKWVRARALSDHGRRKEALDALDDLLGELSESQLQGRTGCSATYLRAKLLGRSRSTSGASADAHVDAVKHCKRHPGVLVKALYAGAKMHARVGRPKRAEAWFARVEKEFHDHRFADDARLRGAKLALRMQNEPKFEKMLSTMARDYPEGDMVEDGLFELAFHHVTDGAWGKAIEPLEQSVKVRPREKKYWEAGRARYFLARAYFETGQRDRSLAEYERVVSDYPLSYYMLLAYGRLRGRTPAEAAQVLARAEAEAPAKPSTEPRPEKLSGPAFVRAVQLLRLSEVSAARGEIRTLGLDDGDADAMWTIARLYARAGDAHLAHQIARARHGSWSQWYPKGRWKRAWELAYPRMHLEIVQRETEAAGIPIPLAYGVMREESAFDADAVSWANAYGLMQLIMPTAKGVARKLEMKVDRQSLCRPEVNIKLGCTLLGSLRNMFSSAPELAIPSYNAGAGATKRWLRRQGSSDFDLWVENIPYDETRGYTKRVLSSVAVYAYLYYPNELALSLQLPEQLHP